MSCDNLRPLGGVKATQVKICGDKSKQVRVPVDKDERSGG